MNFSVNQNRQLYVVKAIKANVGAFVDAGDAVNVLADDYCYINQFNATKEIVRTDLINYKNICSITLSDPQDTVTPLKAALVVLDADVNEGKPILGQDYVLRLVLHNYFGMGNDCDYIKDVAVHVTKTMSTNATAFYTALKNELERSFSREIECPFTFEASATGVTIKEVEGDWNLGTMKETQLVFDVMPTDVIYEGENVIWGKVLMNGATKFTDGTDKGETVAPTPATRAYSNSHTIMDLEYFCMGERGDQYRNVCWPKVINTKYLVTEQTNGYYVLDIHYAYIGDGMENQASEKTLTLVSTTKSLLETIATNIATKAGITVKKSHKE